MQDEHENMKYRGAPDRVHIADGERANMGDTLAAALSDRMRQGAAVAGDEGAFYKPLCPGCYMVALFNAAVTLAKENGQSLTELGNSMAQAFAELAAGGPDRTESIHVVRDDGVDSARIGAELWERARRGDA
jgi:hypothetical protein